MLKLRSEFHELGAAIRDLSHVERPVGAVPTRVSRLVEVVGKVIQVVEAELAETRARVAVLEGRASTGEAATVLALSSVVTRPTITPESRAGGLPVNPDHAELEAFARLLALRRPFALEIGLDRFQCSPVNLLPVTPTGDDAGPAFHARSLAEAVDAYGAWANTGKAAE